MNKTLMCTSTRSQIVDFKVGRFYVVNLLPSFNMWLAHDEEGESAYIEKVEDGTYVMGGGSGPNGEPLYIYATFKEV
ncbi:hypothetical protein [Salmonella phage SSBI34]|nr:hypothetical protein [Salmonella phage SSBI34]